MIITIIAEPRSGSTNLANWFIPNKNFTVFIEPLNKNASQYKVITPVKNWKYNTPHLLIKEIYTVDANLQDITNISDKIIVLYRENKKEQLESWLVANQTNNWGGEWVNNKVDIQGRDAKIKYFENLTEGMQREYIDNSNYFKISYEDLYYKNKFQKLLDYIGVDGLTNNNFPYGTKYRITIPETRNLI
jgi:hypothetical protein